MIIAPNASNLIWLDGEFIPWEAAKMNITANHYGISVFEGLRSYKTKNGPAIFRLQDHTDRLFRSAHILKINIPNYSKNDLNLVQKEIIKKNNFESAYLRPFIFYDGLMGLSLYTHDLSVHIMIIALKWEEKGIYANTQGVEKGIKVHTSSFIRNHVRSVFSKAKANGNYMNSILALQEARSQGADEALILDHEGFISEGSGANIFIIRNNILYTPELTSALEGITRDTVFTLANDIGIPVKEKRITRDELYIADEAFFTGTATEIVPISEVDGRKIGSGTRGEITKRIQDLYSTQVHGLNEKHHQWLDYILTPAMENNYEKSY
jgi:branched-chain amino acid aminotransferase